MSCTCHRPVTFCAVLVLLVALFGINITWEVYFYIIIFVQEKVLEK